MRLREHGSHTSDPQLRQLCLSRASCASLSDVLAHVNLLAQQELGCFELQKRFTGLLELDIDHPLLTYTT